jgi:transposase
MCPGHHESASKRRSGQTRPGSKWLHRTLREAAKAAGRTKGTYLGAQYLRLRARRGAGKATTAVGHSILVAAFHMLRGHITYNELGPDWFDRRSPDQHARRLARQIEALGFNVTIAPAA